MCNFGLAFTTIVITAVRIFLAFMNRQTNLWQPIDFCNTSYTLLKEAVWHFGQFILRKAVHT